MFNKLNNVEPISDTNRGLHGFTLISGKIKVFWKQVSFAMVSTDQSETQGLTMDIWDWPRMNVSSFCGSMVFGQSQSHLGKCVLLSSNKYGSGEFPMNRLVCAVSLVKPQKKRPGISVWAHVCVRVWGLFRRLFESFHSWTENNMTLCSLGHLSALVTVLPLCSFHTPAALDVLPNRQELS